MLEKLMGLMSIGGTFASIGMLHRFLSGMTTIVILSVVSAFMLCIVVAGGYAAAYFVLVHYGLDPFAAIVALSLVALLMAVVLIAITISQIRKLREIPHAAMLRERANSGLGGIRNAFMEGFSGK